MRYLFAVVVCLSMTCSLICAVGCGQKAGKEAPPVETAAPESAPPLAPSAAAPPTAAPEEGTPPSSGKDLFTEHCAVCHPDGGNVINPQKTLQAKDREAHGLQTAEDIVRIMRNPGPGMQTFDDAILPDNEAKKIAEYILETFK